MEGPFLRYFLAKMEGSPLHVFGLPGSEGPFFVWVAVVISRRFHSSTHDTQNAAIRHCAPAPAFQCLWLQSVGTVLGHVSLWWQQ